MTLRSKSQSAGVVIAAMLSAGSISHTLGMPTSHELTQQMQSARSSDADIGSWRPKLAADAAKDDWTSWDGAMRGTSALKHRH